VLRSSSGDSELHRRARLSTAWLNINRFKDHNAPHHHPPAALAAVFYVHATPEQGRLCFLDMNGARAATTDIADGDPVEWVAPRTGRLVLFPGWLWHYVAPNMTDDARISLAFNVHLPPIDAGSPT